MSFSFENKRQVRLLIILVMLIWLVFPFIFKAFMFWMDWVGVDLNTFAAYGPIGDIYGSLNTLFTSATLAFVIYSTILQRQANKDAREAMADQLQHAKDSTAEQLKQARDATATQLKQARKAVDDQINQAREATTQQLDHAKKLSEIQLDHAKKVALQQLNLVQKTHDAQMLESKYAIFSNMFHSLLNQKHERYNRIEVKNSKTHLKATEILLIINETLSDLIDNEWKDISILDVIDIQEKYFETTSKITGESEGEVGDNLSNLFLYLLSYSNLYELISRSEISYQDKIFFKKIVQDSMTIGEQVAMFWIAAFDSDMKRILQNKVIGSFYHERMMPFAVRFLDKSCFSHSQIIKEWDKYLPNKNPT